MKKILQIVESAYRGTLEEQDDTIIWLSHILKDAGGNIDILLRGHAINYLSIKQNASGLMFGQKRQTQPPHIANDIAKIMEKGVMVFYISEDAVERGIEIENFLTGAQKISVKECPQLFSKYNHILHW
ncbi:hypothetical protein [Silvanigrella aquatica]|uniref:DsrE family protein n=1 Tax=Silvanigrella aquatica TaxID=1915309 RepID=A0A1L4D0Z6_9BACT|nr:hypothetical protein [Silvanigrella aquatica]APJ03883.1 hypothetical protein AXG55_08170 [Silvanigrella aquatica]